MRPNDLTMELTAALLAWHAEPGGAEIAFTGRYCFPADFVGFQGHFPDQPILPGILELAALRLLVERVVERDLRLVEATRLKFRAVVRPGDEVVVAGNIGQRGDGWQVSFGWQRGHEKIGDGVLTFKGDKLGASGQSNALS